MEILSDRSRTCCFTGHRAILTEDFETVGYRLNRLVQELYQKGITTFIAGGAQGFDMVSGITVVNFKPYLNDLVFIMAVPCHDYMQNWPQNAVMQNKNLMTRADAVIYVSEGAYERACMKKRNRFMVDHSSVCVAYYNGGKGGTFQTLNMAKEQPLKIIHLGRSSGYAQDNKNLTGGSLPEKN